MSFVGLFTHEFPGSIFEKPRWDIAVNINLSGEIVGEVGSK